VAEFYSAADNLVGLIYETSRAIFFEQISGHSVPGPLVAICKLQAKWASLDRAGLTVNVFWLPAKKRNIQAWYGLKT
jgi:hypothetical protein